MTTAVSGSGPGFVFNLIDAMEKASIKLGFNKEVSKILVTETFKGSINLLLKNKFSAKILASENDRERIPEIDIFLSDGQVWKDDIFEFKVISVPGHTMGHICFYFFNEKIVFTGDTLFSLGCGRVFEGSNEDMFNSLTKLKLIMMI